MIGGFITLASYGIVGGGATGNFLYQLENLGVFSYILPFLMVFAIVYAILSKAHFLGDNNAVNVILSLAVGLMSLQFNFVSYFFAQIFPRLGIGVIIILVAIILLGLFVDFDSPTSKKIFGVLAGIGFVVIVYQSFSDSFGWGVWDPFNSPFWWSIQSSASAIVTFVLVLAAIIAVPVLGNKNKAPKVKP